MTVRSILQRNEVAAANWGQLSASMGSLARTEGPSNGFPRLTYFRKCVLAMKICRKCSETLPLSEFEICRDKQGRVYLRGQCRICRRTKESAEKVRARRLPNDRDPRGGAVVLATTGTLLAPLPDQKARMTSDKGPPGYLRTRNRPGERQHSARVAEKFCGEISS